MLLSYSCGLYTTARNNYHVRAYRAMDLQIPIIDLAVEVEVSTIRARGAGRKGKSASNIKATSKKPKPNAFESY